MAYAPYEFLWIVTESAYGVPTATPVAGTDSIYIRLAGANRFTPRPVPNYVTIPFGGGYDVEGYRVADKYMVSGNLELELCYSQAKLLLGWAITRVNGSNPWTTTEPTGDLASCSVYHGIMRDDGTIKRRQYKGVKVHDWKLALSGDTPQAMLTLGLQAQKWDGNTIDSSADPTNIVFPAPADTAFPTDLAVFPHLASNVSVGGSAVVYLESLELSATNAMNPMFFTSKFLTFDRMRGRKAKADLKVLYTASPNWRTVYEGLTNQAASFTLGNGTNTAAITFNAKNILDPLSDDLTPGKVYNQAFTINNQWDPAASADIGFTYT